MTASAAAAPSGEARQGPSRALQHALFGVVPAIATGWLLYHASAAHIVAVDFRQSFWIAAARALHGGNPYEWTHAQIAAGQSFPYPAFAIVALAPFALLPAASAAALFTALCMTAVPAALYSMRIRDWRLYGVAAVWLPVVVGWQTANLTLPLALGIGLTWRLRDRPGPAGVMAAVLVSLKPIMLPLVLWLLATRRYTAAAWALGVGLVINLGAWSAVGWRSLPRWLELLERQGHILYSRGYGVPALLARLGVGRGHGTLIQIAIAGLVGIVCLAAGRRGRDAAAFTLAVALTIVASPQVDSHYFALLAVPLALAFPRLSGVWLAPLILWVCPATGANGWQQLVWWAVAILVVAVILRRTAQQPLVALPHSVLAAPPTTV